VLEDFVTIGGQAGTVGHIRIGRGSRVGAQAGVTKDLPAGGDFVGSPAEPVRIVFRQIAAIRRLAAGGAKRGKEAG
jgi:UDP-3-O-[3-hydroxymyristoyl] glucosamine N-acyltransferase